MGEMTTVIPQGPNVHCGNEEPHDKHQNARGIPGVGMTDLPSWCDGVPPLSQFVELTIRVPLRPEGPSAKDHKTALEVLARHGLSLFVTYMDHPSTDMVMRVRTADKDRVYPIIKRKGGLAAVVMPDAEPK